MSSGCFRCIFIASAHAVSVELYCNVLLVSIYLFRLHTRRNDVIPDRALQYHRRLHGWTYKLRGIYVYQKEFYK